MMKNFDTIEELKHFLKNTLIPDLYEAGNDATAEDFEDCIAAIETLEAELEAK